MNFDLHRYETVLLEQGRLGFVLRPVEPQPEFQHNWEIDNVDGSLLVCNGKHGKAEGCRYSPFAPSPFRGETFFEKVVVQRAEEFDEDDYLALGIEKLIPKGDDITVMGSAPLFQYPNQMGFMGGWSARNSWRTMWNDVFPDHLWAPQLLVWVAEVKRPMSRTAIEIAKEARGLSDDVPIVVTPGEWELLNAVASDPDRKQYCTRVNGCAVHVRKGNGSVTEAHSGPVWATELEYTGD